MNTPENIVELPEGSFFVFGSNREGLHAGGAAQIAYQRFGAEWGVGEGPTGRCYAIPTMSGFDDIEEAVAKFLWYAAASRSKTFLVTRIGTGIAGYTAEEIAPLFESVSPNVILPVEFEQVLSFSADGGSDD